MLSKVIYWLTFFAATFPLIIIPIPIWLIVVLTIAIFLITIFLPRVVAISEIGFWIWCLIVIFNRLIDFITILAFIFLVIWLVSTILVFYSFNKSHIN